MIGEAGGPRTTMEYNSCRTSWLTINNIADLMYLRNANCAIFNDRGSRVQAANAISTCTQTAHEPVARTCQIEWMVHHWADSGLGHSCCTHGSLLGWKSYSYQQKGTGLLQTSNDWPRIAGSICHEHCLAAQGFGQQ
jgi:hypothetical protein